MELPYRFFGHPPSGTLKQVSESVADGGVVVHLLELFRILVLVGSSGVRVPPLRVPLLRPVVPTSRSVDRK